MQVKNLLSTVLLTITTLGTTCHTIPDDKPIKKEEIIQQQLSTQPAFPLHDAIRTGDITLLGQLLKKGVSVNSVNGQEQEYLDEALLDDYPDRGFSLLLKECDHVDGIDMRRYQTPLLYAVMHNSGIDIIRLLVDHGAHMHEVGALKQTILHHALMHNSGIETIRLLLDHSDIDAKKLLLDHKAAPNAINLLNQTILHYALKNNYPLATISWLLKKGANVNAIDNEKKTPLDYALCEDNTELIKLFANHSVTALKAKFNNTTPLERLIIIGNNTEENHLNSIYNQYNKSNYVIIDYTKTNATDLLNILSNRGMHVNAHTCIEIHAHGDIIADEQHKIELAQVIPTGGFFTYLRAIMQVPLWINLFSCYAGAAHQAIHSLGDGSTLITYSDAKLATTLQQVLYASSSLMAATPYENMIYSWKNCAINPVTISSITGVKETTYNFMHPTEFINKVLDSASNEKSLIDFVNAIMHQVDKIDCDIQEIYPRYKKIQPFSLYEKYLILLNPKLVKENDLPPSKPLHSAGDLRTNL
ncbi:MAG: ankyrin repeat domain-containing protein [Amoebophilaceae bacterium]|nr:ankyrin repeat domain-containing protein [Amoebophilaceae bacterium]